MGTVQDWKKPRQELMAGAETKTMGQHCLLPCLQAQVQGSLLNSSGSQYAGPSSINDQSRNAATDLSTGHLMEAILQVRFPLPGDSIWGQFDKTNLCVVIYFFDNISWPQRDWTFFLYLVIKLIICLEIILNYVLNMISSYCVFGLFKFNLPSGEQCNQSRCALDFPCNQTLQFKPNEWL